MNVELKAGRLPDLAYLLHKLRMGLLDDLLVELLNVVGDRPAGAAEREARADDDRQAQLVADAAGGGHVADHLAAEALDADGAAHAARFSIQDHVRLSLSHA